MRRHARAARDAARPDRARRPRGGLVEAERAIKEPQEIAAIRAAAALADEIYAWLGEQGIVGRTEREVALALEQEMRLRGADEPALPVDRRRRRERRAPARGPARRRDRAGTLVTLDIGARIDGYCSDCTRTWATGELDGRPRGALRDRAGRPSRPALAAVRPGPEGREIDAVARDLIAAAGHGEHFGHGLGHGVGLESTRRPGSPRTAETRLAAGHVVTVEPGIYVPGRGGARIEDLVVVTRGRATRCSRGRRRRSRVVA